MTSPLDPCDLAALMRRGNADPALVRRLEMSIGASRVERELLEVGQCFDRQQTTLENDSALLQRVIARSLPVVAQSALDLVTPESNSPTARNSAATRPASVHFFSKPVQFVKRLTAVALLASASYGAWSGWKHHAAPRSGSGALAATSATSGNAIAPTPEQSQARSTDTAIVNSTPVSAGTSQAGGGPAPRHARASARQTSDDRDTPQSLFSTANALRRAAQLSLAIDKYRQLQATYPRSAEAELSHVMLGRLLLAQSRSAEACAQFDAYLRHAAGDQLVLEALQGQLTCARQLGDKRLEAAACTKLLGRFADSAYAASVRSRCEGMR